MSPVSITAWAAGPDWSTLMRRAPVACSRPSLNAIRRGIGWWSLANENIGPPHASVPGDLAGDEVRGVGRDREADALRAHDDRGVDADDFALLETSGPPELPGLQRRVRLYDVLDHAARPRLQRAPQRRNDACGDGRVKTERIANRDCDLAPP